MKRNDQAVKVAPSTSGAHNGMPEGGGYVYRKGLEPGGWDIMPWAITDDTSTDYDTGLANPESVARRAQRARKPRTGPGRGKCAKCGYGNRSSNHRILCG